MFMEDGESKWVDNNGDDGGRVESSSDPITQFVNEKLLSVPAETEEEHALTHNLLKLKPIGLSIGNPYALRVLLEKQLNRMESSHSQNFKTNRSTKQPVDHSTFLKNAEKMKAANFYAKLVRIGSWQIKSQMEGDLVAKCYYAKKKLVWEYLDKSIKLKKKIEIQWSDISAIRAIIDENKNEILDIELNNLPTFHDEDDPQPRKHTCWKLTRDFTDGQGSIYRRHRLVFLPGCLEKNYEKLLSCDDRLFKLSKKPYPSSSSPYFPLNSLRQSNLFELNNAYGVQMNGTSQLPLLYGSLPALPPPTYGQQPFQPFSASKEMTTSPVSVIEYQPMGESGTSYSNDSLTTYFDPQGTRSYGNESQVLRATHHQAADNGLSYQQNFLVSPDLPALRNVEDQFLNDSLAIENYESDFFSGVDSLNAGLEERVAPEQPQMPNFDWWVSSSSIQTSENERLLYQHRRHRLQTSNESLTMRNFSTYQQPASVTDSIMQRFSIVNNKNHINDWHASSSQRH